MNNYLKGKVGAHEHVYLIRIIKNTRNMYLRKYRKIIDYEIISINSKEAEDQIYHVECEGLEKALISMLDDLRSNELEKIPEDETLYKGIKALTEKQKGVLSSLANNNNNLSKVSRELNIDRKTARALRNSAINVILDFFNEGGN